MNASPLPPHKMDPTGHVEHSPRSLHFKHNSLVDFSFLPDKQYSNARKYSTVSFME